MTGASVTKRRAGLRGETGAVPRAALSASLLVSTILVDGAGAHTLALYLVLAAIPAVAVSALSFFGDLVEGSADDEAGALYVGLTSLALVLLVIGAAVRANALSDAALPALGTSAVVGALALIGLQLTVWLSLRISRERLVSVLHSHASDV
jgi:hypothetical protein